MLDNFFVAFHLFTHFDFERNIIVDWHNSHFILKNVCFTAIRSILSFNFFPATSKNYAIANKIIAVADKAATTLVWFDSAHAFNCLAILHTIALLRDWNLFHTVSKISQWFRQSIQLLSSYEVIYSSYWWEYILFFSSIKYFSFIFSIINFLKCYFLLIVSSQAFIFPWIKFKIKFSSRFHLESIKINYFGDHIFHFLLIYSWDISFFIEHVFYLLTTHMNFAYSFANYLISL